MLIVLARATDEQVAMHVIERRLRIREIQLVLEIQLRPQNASLVTVTRARDGALSQTTAHTQHNSVCPKGDGASLRA